MRTGVVAGTIRIAAASALDLRSGERVTVQVLRAVADGKWAVGLKGRVFPAISAVALNAGDRLSAVVERAGRQIVLRLAGADGGIAAATGPAAETIARAVLQAFAREGVRADEATLARVRARLRAFGAPGRKSARSLAAAMAKGIDPDSPAIDDLLSLLQFEDSPDRGGYRRRRLPRRESAVAAEVKTGLSPDRGDNPLSLFNALRSGQGTWVVLPFSFRYGDRDLDGTVRLLYAGSRPVRLALDVKGTPGRSSWSFLLSDRADARRLQIFCDTQAGRNRAFGCLPGLRTKLQNHGVEVDDSISDARLFDGYSAEGGGVDLLG